MIDLLIFVGYALAWLTSTTYSVRWLADNHAHCNGQSVDGNKRLMDGSRTAFRDMCDDWHGEGCWRPDGEITLPRFAISAVTSAAWPVVVPLLVSWSIANRRPTAIGLQRKIKRLEREAGIR